MRDRRLDLHRPRVRGLLSVVAMRIKIALATIALAGCAIPGPDSCPGGAASGETEPPPRIEHELVANDTFVDASRYDRALAQWKRLPRSAPTVFFLAPAGAISGTVWKAMGPSPIVEKGCCGSPHTFAANGRVTSVAVDPTDPDVLYLGSAGGGVWKTTDGGAHWTALTDQEASLGVGSSHAIAIDPNHPATVYVGTSSFGLLAQSQPRPLERSQARGILRSTDGGASWIRLGTGAPTGNVGNAAALFTGVNINTIIVDPADSNALYLAAGRGGDATTGGVFWSTDGGLNWTQGLGTESMMVESLVLDASSPANARALYAGAWDTGVLKSIDGGRHWTTVLSTSTPALAPFGPIHKVMVAVAPPANPPLPAGPAIYASVMMDDFELARIFANTNGGAAADWVHKPAHVLTYMNTDLSELRGGGFSDIVVDPDSPGDGEHDVIYWGGWSQYVSTDSGANFDEIGQIHGLHGDHQAWLVVPKSGTNTVYAGDDGGIWRSEDRGASWTGTSPTSLASTLNGGGLQIATLYQLTVQQDASASVTIGGAQDSGVLRTTGGMTWTGTSDDGIDIAFDKVATNVAYGIQNTSFDKSENAGATWSINFNASLPASQIGIFRNRFGIDPNNAGHLYVGGAAGEVLQSMNAAAPGGTPTFRSFGVVAPGKYVASIDVAKANSNRVVVAANDFAGGRRVLVWSDALDAIVDVPQDITADLPSRFVTRVAFDPHDDGVVYATLAGFGGGHVFRKSIGDASWTDVSPPVDIPVNAITFDGSVSPAIVYIGTDLGVLRRSVAAGDVWEVVDDLHLPNAAVSDLEINTTAGVLRAATWGRGVFELAAPTGPAISVDPTQLLFDQTCAVGADAGFVVSNEGTQNLAVSSVERTAGSPAFTVLPTPATPLAIAPGVSAAFTVHYAPIAGPAQSAIIRVQSDDPQVPSVALAASGWLDATAPNITSVTAAPSFLWPPNHKMVSVTLSVAVTDNCDSGVLGSCHIVAVSSNEPVDGIGDGNTAPDWQITGNLTVMLRAERAGGGTGRIYTIAVQCTDDAGNTASRSTIVRVPHL